MHVVNGPADSNSNGWLAGVRRLASENHDKRPPGTRIELVVIHAISLPPGEFGSAFIEQLFTNRLRADAHAYFADIATLRVSAHLLISRNGLLTQFVSFDQRAWHAGQSLWCGREKCNDFSIGIELEGCDDAPFTATQYAALAFALDQIQQRYPWLSADNLAGHSDIAPGRKTDPGPHFDWPQVRRMLER